MIQKDLGFVLKRYNFRETSLIASIYTKKSEIWLIAHADIVSDYDFLRSDLAKAKVAGKIFNFLERVIEIWDTNPYIFNLLKDCLDLLGRGEKNFAPTFV